MLTVCLIKSPAPRYSRRQRSLSRELFLPNDDYRGGVGEDELIRQVTINCAERGLLLLRVRDEIHMTIAAYQTIYESSIAFGIRKTLVAEQRKAEMGAKVGMGSAARYASRLTLPIRGACK